MRSAAKVGLALYVLGSLGCPREIPLMHHEQAECPQGVRTVEALAGGLGDPEELLMAPGRALRVTEQRHGGRVRQQQVEPHGQLATGLEQGETLLEGGGQHPPLMGLVVVFSALGGTTGSVITGQLFAHLDGRTAFTLMLVVLVCCNIGLNTRGGPREIGAAVTRAVVVSLILILVLDYFVTKALL